MNISRYIPAAVLALNSCNQSQSAVYIPPATAHQAPAIVKLSRERQTSTKSPDSLPNEIQEVLLDIDFLKSQIRSRIGYRAPYIIEACENSLEQVTCNEEVRKIESDVRQIRETNCVALDKTFDPNDEIDKALFRNRMAECMAEAKTLDDRSGPQLPQKLTCAKIERDCLEFTLKSAL